MPLDRRAVIQISLLVLAVPTQFWVSKYWSASKEQRSNAIQNIVIHAKDISDRYLSWQSWKEWCADLLGSTERKPIFSSKTSSSSITSSKDTGNKYDPTTLLHRDPDGYFAGSSVPRSPRRSSIKYRVGQVIRHKKWGYRGVIIGWDDNARAPEFWLRRNHPPDKAHWRDLPNYSVLVDIKDRKQPQITYVAEENIEVIIDTKIMHPDLDDFFDAFEGARYLPRAWLKSLYPHD